MVTLLSFMGEWAVAAVVVSVVVGLVGLGAASLDIKEKPWKYRDWLDADKAKGKAKRQSPTPNS